MQFKIARVYITPRCDVFIFQ